MVPEVGVVPVKWGISFERRGYLAGRCQHGVRQVAARLSGWARSQSAPRRDRRVKVAVRPGGRAGSALAGAPAGRQTVAATAPTDGADEPISLPGLQRGGWPLKQLESAVGVICLRARAGEPEPAA
jgi:hypothetical protein